MNSGKDQATRQRHIAAMDATFNHPLPFPRSYWVSTHRQLLAGAYPGDADPTEARAKVTALVGAGVRLVVNLMEEIEIGHDGKPLEPYEELLRAVAAELSVHARLDRFSIPDMDVPAAVRMKSILDAIDTAIADDTTVYVHCWGGRGRTGTVIGCWLARHGVATGKAALERTAGLRAGVPKAHLPSPETNAQREMVRGWKENYE